MYCMTLLLSITMNFATVAMLLDLRLEWGVYGVLGCFWTAFFKQARHPSQTEWKKQKKSSSEQGINIVSYGVLTLKPDTMWYLDQSQEGEVSEPKTQRLGVLFGSLNTPPHIN